MTQIRKPQLVADTTTLFNLYYDNLAVGAGDIRRTFGCSEATATRVINAGIQYAEELGYNRYPGRYITTKLLFDLYGWDIEDITNREKIKSKIGGKRNAQST